MPSTTTRIPALLGFTLAVLTGCSLVAPTEIPPLNPTLVASEEPPAPTQSPEPDPEPEPEPEPADQDPMLRDLLSTLIPGEVPNINIYATKSFPSGCPGDIDGCFTGSDQSIYISDSITDFRLPEILAHEYLHYIWARDRLYLDEELTGALIEAYQDSEGLGAAVPDWIEEYFEDGDDPDPNELFAYACTILRPDQMAKVISSECANHLELDELPANQTISASDMYQQINELREDAGYSAFSVNSHAEKASQAYADTFTPSYQPTPDEYPDSARQHLNAGCAPAQYVYALTRPHDFEELWQELDSVVSGNLLGGSHRGIGIATKTFDYIDASALFEGRVIQVNATVLVATICE